MGTAPLQWNSWSDGRGAARRRLLSGELTGGSVNLLEVQDVTVRFGGIIALDGLSFDIDEGQICGLIGPNGAGKTTMFNVVSRIYQPTSGHLTFRGTDLLDVPAHGIARLGIARTFQNLALFPSMTLLENVMVGAHSQGKVGFSRAVFRLGANKEDRETREFAAQLLTQLGLGPLMFRPAMGLPFGTLKRLEIARALAARPTFLLMDEPASGLTHSEVDELGQTIVDIRGQFDLTILLVEHHMSMVMGISDKVVAMEFGRKIAEGPPSSVQADDRVIASYLGTGA
jgi:branched-chain amino acid transport system ATP-binding protein